MNITLLENAGVSLAKVRALEAMITDIDGIRGNGVPVVSGRNNGAHSDPTFRATLELEQLRKKLLTEKEQARKDYLAAEAELETVSGSEMRLILFWRYMRNLPWHEVAERLGPGFSTGIKR